MDEYRTIQSKRRYILAFLIGTFIFVIGFIITYTISYIEFSRMSNIQDQTSYAIFEDKLYYRFFNESDCFVEKFNKISEDLREQRSIMAVLEDRLEKNNKNVLFRKKFYTLIELEHLELVRHFNKNCNSNTSTILFFYSNEKEDIEQSEDAGKILDYLSNKYPELIIYSFDINLESGLIVSLKQKYNVSESPIIIINEDKKITGKLDVSEIESNLFSTISTSKL